MDTLEKQIALILSSFLEIKSDSQQQNKKKA